MIEAESSQILPEFLPEHLPLSIPVPIEKFPSYTLDALSIETDTVGDAVFKLEILQDSLDISTSQKENLEKLIFDLKQFSDDSNLKDSLDQLQNNTFTKNQDF